MKKMILLISLLYTIGFSNSPQKIDPNSLYNGGFEEGAEGWNIWGSKVDRSALYNGKNGLNILNKKHEWSGADQVLEIPAGTYKIKASGWMKTEWVQKGKEPWEKARITVEFLDESRSLTGGYPPVVTEVDRTTNWTHYEKAYRPFSGAKYVKYIVALGNARGEVQFDDLKLVFLDKENRVLHPAPITGPLDWGDWYEYPKGTSGSHYVDWSHLLHAPAGKHGFLKSIGEEFQFEDGTPAKFWGVNLVEKNIFASHETMDSLATRLAKMGCNIVRLHHMDAPWSVPNIFGNKEGTREFSEESLDRVDYLIAALKKKGIYTFLDLLVHREFTLKDGIAEKVSEEAAKGAKQVGFFDPKLIELQKEFIKNLLEHKNKYTGLAYKDEPAIVASEFINESSIFTTFTGDLIGDGHYRDELRRQFHKEGNKGDLVQFSLNWDTGRGVLKTDKRGPQVNKSVDFLYNRELAYYKDMYAFMREIDVKHPLAGSNFPPPILAAMKANAEMDFTITNDYWDHPQVWKIKNDWSRRLYAPINNRSQLRSPRKNLVHSKAFFQTNNKPMMITEWNHCFPNEFVLEGVPMMAAYAQLQGWDGVMQFETDHNALGTSGIASYVMSVTPEDVAGWVVAAPMYLRGDISKAKNKVVESIVDSIVKNVPSYTTFLDENYWLPFTSQTVKDYSEKPTSDIAALKKFHNESKGEITSDTEELVYNYKMPYWMVKTSKLQGVMGKLTKGAVLENIEVSSENPNVSVFLTSYDGQPLNKSKRMILTVVTPSKLKGQKYSKSRNAIIEAGQLPLMIQKFEGRIVLKNNENLKDLVAFEKLPTGELGKELSLKKIESGYEVDINNLGSQVVLIQVK